MVGPGGVAEMINLAFLTTPSSQHSGNTYMHTYLSCNGVGDSEVALDVGLLRALKRQLDSELAILLLRKGVVPSWTTPARTHL